MNTTEWQQKIEAQITFLRDHVCSGPMHENPEVTEVSVNTMQALLDVAIAAEKVETPPPVLRDALDKLREAGNEL